MHFHNKFLNLKKYCCELCNKSISSQSDSGRCVDCYWENYEYKNVCSGCNKNLKTKKISGMCQKCYYENYDHVNKCTTCNATLKNKAKTGLCKKCLFTNLTKVDKRKVDRPSYDVLKQKVTDNGLSATGREYGVAGNTIKQWICKYETGKCR